MEANTIGLILTTAISIPTFIWCSHCWYFGRFKHQWINTVLGFGAAISYIPVMITMSIWGLRIADITIKWWG